MHDSARKQVSGEALYIDDLPEPARTLQVFVAWSTKAHARVTRLDVEAVRTAPGVACVLTAADVPGHNDVSPAHRGDDPIFADGLVEYYGQSLFAVAADTVRQARDAARLADGRVRAARARAGRRPGAAGRQLRHRGHADAARRRGARDPRRPAQARGAHPDRRPGPLLPRGAGRDGRARRGRRHAGPLLDPAPLRGPAHGGLGARPRRPRGHGRDPPHGRRLRRQGDPGQPVRRDRGARRAQDRPGRQVPARPRRRHDHDRQAPRLRGRLPGRLRRGRPHPGRRDGLPRPLRLLGRPLRAGDRPGAVPRRQRLLLPGRPARELPLQDQHGLQHRLPRLRRPAGHGGGRADDRGGGLRHRARPARGQEAQPLRRRRAQPDALLAGGAGQCPARPDPSAWSRTPTTGAGARRSGPSTGRAPG